MQVAHSNGLHLRHRPSGAGETCRQILKTLPEWFGIPESVEDYIQVADRSPTVIASLGSTEVGLLTLVQHTTYSAEIFVMAVLPRLHRQGVGQALVRYAESMLAPDGVIFLQVKTLGPSKPDAGYKKTDADHGNSPLSIIESPQVIARVG